MTFYASLSNARLSAQKMRLVAKMVVGKSVESVTNILSFCDKDAAKVLHKLVNSAIANAENNHGANIDFLFVKSIQVNDAASFKRFHARARGRGNRITKRNCHVEVELSEVEQN